MQGLDSVLNVFMRLNWLMGFCLITYMLGMVLGLFISSILLLLLDSFAEKRKLDWILWGNENSIFYWLAPSQWFYTFGVIFIPVGLYLGITTQPLTNNPFLWITSFFDALSDRSYHSHVRFWGYISMLVLIIFIKINIIDSLFERENA